MLRALRHERRNTWALATLALGLAAAGVQWASRRAERRYPARGQFLEVNGVRLHYIERGQGEPLVLLHGDGSMLQDLEVSGLIDRASQRHRVIAFDRPGYGFSDRPRGRTWDPEAQATLLLKALYRLKAERPIVVAHSWATLIAISMALAKPERVRGLVLLGGYYYPTLRFDVAMLSPPALPIVGDAMRYTVSPLVARAMWPLFRWRLFSPAKPPARFRDYPLSLMFRPRHLRAAAEEAALLIPSAAKLRPRYRDLETPFVLVAGEKDKYVNTEHHTLRLHRELPESELLVVQGAGHMVHHTAPENIIAAIEAVERLALLRGEPAATSQRGEAPVGRVTNAADMGNYWTGH